MPKKPTKSKPYKPQVVFYSEQDADDFLAGLAQIANFLECENNAMLTSAFREYFKELALGFTRKMLGASYPKTVSFKKYEAMFMFQCSSSMNPIRQKFTGFINGVHQHLIV